MRRLSLTPGAVCASALVALSLALVSGAGAASASSRSYECQHPMTTGEEAYAVHGINPHVACRAVRALAAWLQRGDNASRLYRCKRSSPDAGGVPILKLHTFDGYSLRISNTYGFVMYKGNTWFAVGGTDFPLNCT